MERMLSRFLPFVVCVLALVLLGSKAPASFLTADALPEVSVLCSAASQDGESLPSKEESRRGFWHKTFYLGFLLFADGSEVSAASSCEDGSWSSQRSPVSQQGRLDDQQAPNPEVVAWLADVDRALTVTPYVCRLFRPPRDILQ
jgi:hypothetical protein